VKSSASDAKAFDGAEDLISEAFSAIDKAVLKGILHKNTGARRKSKLCRYKTRALTDLCLYTPASA